MGMLRWVGMCCRVSMLRCGLVRLRARGPLPSADSVPVPAVQWFPPLGWERLAVIGGPFGARRLLEARDQAWQPSAK